MPQPCYFLFGIHNHQPVGNFRFVMDEAFERAYEPFIAVLERHPKVRIALHITGCLMDYLLPEHPEFIKRLRELGDRGQIEFMTGGYYEPILPIVPDHDKYGQIQRLSETVERHFGQRPVGMWLAERVWEPHLPKAMAEAGIRYCVLDDTIFKCAGLSTEDCFGYYLTDELGHSVALFPILMKLRYTIPFEPPEATFDFLAEAAERSERPLLAVMADDGEKFGVWPKTYHHCYEEGWVDRFFAQLEQRQDQFPMITFSEALERFEPLGRTYLPTASYSEMMEWAMPTGAIRAYEHAREQLERHELTETVGPFFRGGLWRNFFAKYPESNQIHKKMLLISRRIERAKQTPGADHQALQSAQDALWRGQCNCAYWHGVFGGIYLSHLRHALHHNLNMANRMLGAITHEAPHWISVEHCDYDADTHEELIVETDRWLWFISLRYGGVFQELNWKPLDLNLVDVLSRRPEAYHDQVAGARVETPEQQALSHQTETIHGEAKAKEPGLDQLLHYDDYRRLFGVDHFYHIGLSFEDCCADVHQERGDFYDHAWNEKVGLDANSASIALSRRGSVFDGQHLLPVQLTKTIHLDAGTDHFRINYAIHNLSSVSLRTIFGIEYNINLLAGDAPDRRFWIDGQEIPEARLNARQAAVGVNGFGLRDQFLGLEVRFDASCEALLWRRPIETVSNSEAGFERIYQGTSMMPHWPIEVASGDRWNVGLTIACRRLETHEG